MLIYVYKQGDTLWEISTAFGISLDTLVLANPQIKDVNEIMPGEQIYIPQASAPATKIPDKSGENNPVSTQNQLPFIYICPGQETLMQISQKFKLNYNLLQRNNKHLQNKTALKRGDLVFIPQAKTGQSLAFIANKGIANPRKPLFRPGFTQNKPMLANCIFQSAKSQINNPKAINTQSSSRPWVPVEEIAQENIQVAQTDKGAIIICPHCSESLTLPKSLVKE